MRWEVKESQCDICRMWGSILQPVTKKKKHTAKYHYYYTGVNIPVEQVYPPPPGMTDQACHTQTFPLTGLLMLCEFMYSAYAWSFWQKLFALGLVRAKADANQHMHYYPTNKIKKKSKHMCSYLYNSFEKELEVEKLELRENSIH
jgi:hypothetical protein